MTPIVTTAAAAGMLVLLTGCIASRPSAEAVIVPAMEVRHAFESAQGYYTLGRFYHGSRRFEEALQAYGRALQLEAGHAPARNAMAAIHAGRGEYAHAIGLLREIEHSSADPATLFNNLGYIYSLQGDYPQAKAMLEKALALDAGNVRARNNLARVLARLDGREPQVMADPDARSEPDVAHAGVRSAERPAVEAATRAYLREAGAGIVEVVTRPTEVPVRPAVAPRPDGFSPASVRAPAPLEISNGNGIPGMARRFARLASGKGAHVVRVFNEPRFDVETTRVEYRAGFERDARKLAEDIGSIPAVFVRMERPGPALRLVLGKNIRADSRRDRSRMSAPALAGDAEQDGST